MTTPPADKKLTIAGKYTANPATIGAFANGYPQRALEDFVQINQAQYPEISGLTVSEYACATQVAVWATLGQLAVEGTAFTAGRATLPIQYDDPQKIRTFKAVEIILDLASYWDRPLKDGLSIRQAWDNGGSVVNIENREGIVGAEKDGAYGIKKETINGVEYYTRSFVASSATSNFKHDYYIELWAENAPEGTVFTDTSNHVLETVEWDGQTLYRLPTPDNLFTDMNDNGTEYAAAFKIAMPVRATPPDGDVIIHGTTTVTQYNIFLANNTDASEQSFVIADPLYGSAYCTGGLKWTTVVTPYVRLVVNKTDEMGAPLEGAAFTLTGSDGSTLTGASDKNGQVIWETLKSEVEYTLTETSAPAGYLVAAPIGNIRIPSGQTETIHVQNKTERTFTLRKLDAQNKSPLIGAVFTFEQVDGGHKTTYTTGHNGTLEFHGAELPYGTYRVYETIAPEGYQKDEHMETVTWDGAADVNLVFENVRTPSFVLIKMDEETHDSLEDASFHVYKDGAFITSVTTDNAGYARVSGLTEGYYEVEETVAPKGYRLDSTRHGIHIDPYDPALEEDPVLVITNKAKPGLIIQKYDAQTMRPMPDTTFAVYHDTTLIGHYTTDEDGEIWLNGLEDGTYTVKEIATDSSHVVQSCPQSIEIKAGQTGPAKLVFLNKLKPGIHFVKLDSETMQPLAGATFRVTMENGSFVKDFTTGADGEVDLPDMELGVYTVQEIAAPDGYELHTEVRTFEAKANENVQLVFTNTKKPNMEIRKVDADSGEPLSGAVFRIAKIGDGTRYYDRKTDEEGKILLEGIDSGIYSVQEILPPSGYQLNNTEYHVELFPGETSTLIVKNHVKPSLRIIKYDMQTGKTMAGTTFEVYRDAELIGTYTTDENGQINLSNLKPGTYLVKEVATDDNHVVNSTPQQIKIKADSKDTAVLVFLNQQKPYIRLVKLDSETMQPLPNAKFVIKKVGGSFSKEYTTDENGEIKLEKLDGGAYTVQEIQAPDGYLIDDSIRTIQLNPDEYATFVFTDTKKPSIKIG